MSFGPLAAVESDVGLLEDVIVDALGQWAAARLVAVTPRSEERMKHMLVRAVAVSDQVRELCQEIRTVLVDVERERRRTA